MKVYMVGIGGIGMSALAQFYATHGWCVTGSDRESSPTTKLLEKKGIAVSIGQRAENVPEDVDLIVYSDAVWEDNQERVRAKELGLQQISYFDALGEVTKDAFTIAVSGTHGKTTTAAMLTKILIDAGKNPTAIIGSIVKDFGSNFVKGTPNLFVVEACEYKDHILKLHPRVLVITNIEWDHTDWFKTEADMRATFQKAINTVPRGGVVVGSQVISYMISPVQGMKFVDYGLEQDYEIALIGKFNKDNARAAAAAARAAFPDIPDVAVRTSLKAFLGSWRRFEYKGTTDTGALVYDDYAHHPTAVRETLTAARAKFPDKKITIVFHPHLYSRTRDLFQGFVDELAKADRVIMVPIYPAREAPIPGVISDAVAAEIVKKGTRAVALHSFEEIKKDLRASVGSHDLILTMGAGDVYKVADALVRKP